MSRTFPDGRRTPRALLAVTLVAAFTGGPAHAAPATTPGGGSGTSCATTGSVDFGFDLAGDGWRFTTGDDPAWAAPSFVDAGWRAWSVPDNWNDDAALASYDGFAWYRRTFTLPARPDGVTDSAVVAAIGRIDDADQTFLNGAGRRRVLRGACRALLEGAAACPLRHHRHRREPHAGRVRMPDLDPSAPCDRRQ
jgi:hypothetical protein